MVTDPEEDPDDFFRALALESDDDEDLKASTDSTESSEVPASLEEPEKYNARKPNWWKNLSGKASKGQRLAMAAMMDYRLDRPAFGETINWDAAFPNNSTTSTSQQADVWLELGFGGGENLLALAQQYPKVRFVGAEVHQKGLGKIYSRMHQGVQRKRFWTGYTKFSAEVHLDPSKLEVDPPEMSFCDEETIDPYSNLRVYSGDGVLLLPYLATGSVSAILVTFPDPFAKERYKAYRLIQTTNLLEMHRVLLDEGGRLYLATDHEGHHIYSHSVVGAMKDSKGQALFRLVTPCPDRQEWLPVVSKYERKGWEEGCRTWLSCWEAIAVTGEMNESIVV
jgi:tRNA (guanine-N7-)-methyltransferase